MMGRRLRFRFGTILAVSCASLLLTIASLASLASAMPVSAPAPDDRATAPAALTHTTYLPFIARGGPFPNCRLGIGQGGQAGYDVAPLHMGWYLNWTATMTPAHPNQAEYLQMIRLQPAFGGYTFTPPTATLYAIMAANPGATWLIGNEPDSPFQDNLTPEEYARAYHHLYDLLKSYDPGVKVGTAAIVQPTPIRFEYLNRVWAAYLDLYGQPLPADLWNVHSYMLREITPDDPEAIPNGSLEVWGAYIPPGITATRGVLYNYSDQDNLTIFRQRIIDFRSWMSDHSQRDKPLLITEYGILFPEDYTDENGVLFSQERAAAFMRASSDLLLDLRDDSIGNPLDGHRLVQRWAWYSLSDMTFGGALFDPVTKARRPLGDAYAAYASALAPSVDLAVPYAYGNPPALIWTGQVVTASLKATLSNQGNMSIARPFTVTFWDAPPGTGSIIGSPQVVTGRPAGCGDAVSVGVNWPMLGVGLHEFYVQVDSAQTIDESDESNNVGRGQVFVGTQQIDLPVGIRSP